MDMTLFIELLQHLREGAHIALLAPRHSGKALVLHELQRRAELLPEPERPSVILLRLLDFRDASEERFVSDFCQRLQLKQTALEGFDDLPLAAKISQLLNVVISEREAPIWLFLQNITEASAPIARALLNVLQEAHEAPEMRGHLSAVITGSQEFVPLTYQENSPYRHAVKFFVTGVDRDLTRRFFLARVVGKSLPDGFSDIAESESTTLTDDALDLLHRETGGYARFIEEIVLTANRPGSVDESALRPDIWSAERIQRLVQKFVDEHMIFEPFCKLSLGDVERDLEAWNLLQDMVVQRNPIQVSSVQPHLLEMSGIGRRDDRGTMTVSSPIWERFLTKLMCPRRRADVYARLGEWERAWQLYDEADGSNSDRPLDGEDRYMLDSVIDSWADGLVDFVSCGSKQVPEFFFKGARHLFGVQTAVLLDRASDEIIARMGRDDASPMPPEREDVSNLDDAEIELRLFPGRLEVQSAPMQNRIGQISDFDPVLRLTREHSREIDTATIARLRKPLHRFWHAFLAARRAEYDATLGDLRKRHLQVVDRVNKLLSFHPGSMEKVVRGTVDALIEIAGYFRILICLVSPDGRRIQAVAGRCHDHRFDFNFETDYPLDRNTSQDDWDIQQWVAIKGESKVVRDARLKQDNPKTNDEQAKSIEMQAIAVVPLRLERQGGVVSEVIGTIHFERMDKSLPSVAELRSFEILAGQIAVAFDQARRTTMLERSLQVLEDEFRIYSPNGGVLYRNGPAAKKDGVPEGNSWQYPVSPRASGASRGQLKQDAIDEAVRKKAPFHRYIKHDASGLRRASAWDEYTAPITDFRSRLKGIFKSDGLLGYVQLKHELTDLVNMHEALQQWLGLNNSRKTAEKILRYFEKNRIRWCRIYLLREDERKQPYLESFEEFGLTDSATAQQFRNGQFRIKREEKSQQAWFLIDRLKQLAVLELDARLKHGPVHAKEVGRGIPTIRTRDNWREEFGKKDEMWLEAPLIVGEEVIGLIALSKPDEFPPEWYEKLRWCVITVAFALHNALHAEQEIVRQREEAWRSAAELAIHQLSNKLPPVESSCHFVRKWLQSTGGGQGSDLDEAIELLASAEQGIVLSREILNDFRRYASDTPFGDIRVHCVADLFTSLQRHLRFTNAKVSLHVEPPSNDLRVAASLSSMFEVFEILLNNSLSHSGRKPEDLRVKITARSIAPDHGPHPEGITRCCLIYEDNGDGVRDDLRDRIFDPFFTTDQKGNGLGLAIARRFLQRQRGRIAEEGSEGTGARFCIYLPTDVSTLEEVDHD